MTQRIKVFLCYFPPFQCWWEGYKSLLIVKPKRKVINHEPFVFVMMVSASKVGELWTVDLPSELPSTSWFYASKEPNIRVLSINWIYSNLYATKQQINTSNLTCVCLLSLSASFVSLRSAASPSQCLHDALSLLHHPGFVVFGERHWLFRFHLS